MLTEIIQQQLIISTSKPTHEYFTMQCWRDLQRHCYQVLLFNNSKDFVTYISFTKEVKSSRFSSTQKSFKTQSLTRSGSVVQESALKSWMPAILKSFLCSLVLGDASVTTLAIHTLFLISFQNKHYGTVTQQPPLVLNSYSLKSQTWLWLLGYQNHSNSKGYVMCASMCIFYIYFSYIKIHYIV